MNSPIPEQPPHSTSDAARSPIAPAEPLTRATDDEQQAEYLAAYQLQLRRMSCPGCGEGESSF